MSQPSNLSAAHLRSAFANHDPAYSATTPLPAPVDAPSAWYPRAEYECFMLEKLRSLSGKFILNAFFPGDFHTPAKTTFFRRKYRKGEVLPNFNGKLLSASLGRTKWTLKLPETAPADGQFDLFLNVPDVREEIPAVFSELEGWTASTDGFHYEPAVRGGDPRGMRFPRLEIELKSLSAAEGIYYDGGRELLADLEIRTGEKPELAAGESIFEMNQRDPKAREQSLELQEQQPGIWTTPHPLAFRYFRILNGTPDAVFCRACMEPAQYRGAFAADPELTQIWMTSAYTVRTCFHYFLLDGIKRDRLPWMGDLALSLMADAYTFAEPAPIRNTLTALGRAGIRKKHINGITDYTLWYLICHDLYQLYFKDPEFLKRQYPEILDVLDVLLEQSKDGYLPPGDWLFIDWVPGEKMTALQVLFFWALNAAKRLAERLGDEATAIRCSAKASFLRTALLREAYDEQRGLFFSVPGKPDSGFTRYANFFAVLSGMVGKEKFPQIRTALTGRELPPVGTPYQAALEILALHRCGASNEALNAVRTLWGSMLKLDATTFFEAYSESDSGDQHYAFYGRPCAMSLCHAWSAGPAALLPILLFDCEPESDGWASFRCRPQEGVSTDAALTVPTPLGTITAEFRDGGWKTGRN